MIAPERPALCYPGRVDGIDVSVAQTITDASAVFRAGFRFATVKSAEGVTYCDPRALDHLRRLRDAGLIANVYTFLRPSQGQPRAQVKRAYDCAGAEFPMRIALDLEGAPSEMTAEELLDFAHDAIDETQAHGVLLPEVYTYRWFYDQRCLSAFASSDLVGACPLWMAHYGSNSAPWAPGPLFEPYTPAPWTTWTKHQYSGDGGYRVPGIVGACDRDLFRGDLDAFRSYMGLDDAVPDTLRVVHPSPYDDEPPPTAA